MSTSIQNDIHQLGRYLTAVQSNQLPRLESGEISRETDARVDSFVTSLFRVLRQLAYSLTGARSLDPHKKLRAALAGISSRLTNEVTVDRDRRVTSAATRSFSFWERWDGTEALYREVESKLRAHTGRSLPSSLELLERGNQIETNLRTIRDIDIESLNFPQQIPALLTPPVETLLALDLSVNEARLLLNEIAAVKNRVVEARMNPRQLDQLIDHDCVKAPFLEYFENSALSSPSQAPSPELVQVLDRAYPGFTEELNNHWLTWPEGSSTIEERYNRYGVLLGTILRNDPTARAEQADRIRQEIDQHALQWLQNPEQMQTNGPIWIRLNHYLTQYFERPTTLNAESLESNGIAVESLALLDSSCTAPCNLIRFLDEVNPLGNSERYFAELPALIAALPAEQPAGPFGAMVWVEMDRKINQSAGHLWSEFQNEGSHLREFAIQNQEEQKLLYAALHMLQFSGTVTLDSVLVHLQFLQGMIDQVDPAQRRRENPLALIVRCAMGKWVTDLPDLQMAEGGRFMLDSDQAFADQREIRRLLQAIPEGFGLDLIEWQPDMG